jgi:hypothetical protein
MFIVEGLDLIKQSVKVRLSDTVSGETVLRNRAKALRNPTIQLSNTVQPFSQTLKPHHHATPSYLQCLDLFHHPSIVQATVLG